MTATQEGSETSGRRSLGLLNERGGPTQPSQEVQMHTTTLPHEADVPSA